MCNVTIVVIPDYQSSHHDTQATGAVFFHRFFMLQSFKQFDRWVVAASCLFLAGKVEETPKKCKDILKTVKAHLTELQWARFGPDPKVRDLVCVCVCACVRACMRVCVCVYV